MTQHDLQVRTSKIVAGLEAEKTNELFQSLAHALENNLDSKAAISSVKNGDSTQQTKVKGSKKESKTKITSKSTKILSPARNEVKPKKLPSQRNSMERKPPIREKEKISSKSKIVDSKKVKKVPSKEPKPKEEIQQKFIANGNGSVESESQNSITPPPKEDFKEKEKVVSFEL